MEKIEKKQIPEKTAVKAFINGFVSYGIIFGFLTIICIATVNWIFHGSNINQDIKFTIVTSILKAIVIFFIILFICRISTFDVLKNCKVKKENITNINKKMKIFFVICAIFSLMISALYLSTTYLNMKKQLDYISSNNYNDFKDTNTQIAEALTNIEIEKSQNNWLKYKISLSITEFSILFSILYLISYQKKMIMLYNEATEQ